MGCLFKLRIPEWHRAVEFGVLGTVFLEDSVADVFVAEMGPGGYVSVASGTGCFMEVL